MYITGALMLRRGAFDPFIIPIFYQNQINIQRVITNNSFRWSLYIHGSYAFFLRMQHRDRPPNSLGTSKSEGYVLTFSNVHFHFPFFQTGLLKNLNILKNPFDWTKSDFTIKTFSKETKSIEFQLIIKGIYSKLVKINVFIELTNLG